MLDFKACVKLVCMFLTINKVYCIVFYNTETKLSQTLRGHIVVGSTTTYAISAYHN